MNKIINQIVGDRYYVLKHVGKGGFSNVYKVRDIHTRKVYALKEYVTSDPANEQKTFKGIEREVEILRYKTHPNLPKIYNLIKENNHFYLVMELVEGTDLKMHVRQHGRMRLTQITEIMEQVCSALYYLHSLDPPIIYRDLKPSNIILKDDGSIKLIDFGISKRYREDIDIDRLILGSRGFAAPEQFGGALLNTDVRTDIYGIGATMYYLKTGKMYSKHFPVIFPLRLKRIIRKCTRSNPNERYQNCIEVLCKLKSLHNAKK